MGSTWTDFPDCMGFPNYQISQDGVRNKRNKYVMRLQKQDYLYVKLTHANQGSKTYAFHILLAKAFIENDDPVHKTTVDHIDRDPYNNNVANLRWATYSQQALNTSRQLGGSCCGATLTNSAARSGLIQLSLETGMFIKRWESAAAAARELEIDHSTICAICRGSGISIGGFRWVWEFAYNPNAVLRHNRSRKPVIQMKQDGTLVKCWESAAMAGKTLNIHPSQITRVCKGKAASAGKFIWQYVDPANTVTIGNTNNTHSEPIPRSVRNVPSENVEWKTLVVLKRTIEVSSNGQVRAINGRPYIQAIRKGYLSCSISHKRQRVHRLVATAFIPNPNNLPVVNHKDNNKSNNTASNLEWCTQKQNIEHHYATLITTKKDSRARTILKVDANGIVVEDYPSVVAAAKANMLSHGQVYADIKKYVVSGEIRKPPMFVLKSNYDALTPKRRLIVWRVKHT